MNTTQDIKYCREAWACNSLSQTKLHVGFVFPQFGLLPLASRDPEQSSEFSHTITTRVRTCRRARSHLRGGETPGSNNFRCSVWNALPLMLLFRYPMIQISLPHVQTYHPGRVHPRGILGEVIIPPSSSPLWHSLCTYLRSWWLCSPLVHSWVLDGSFHGVHWKKQGLLVLCWNQSSKYSKSDFQFSASILRTLENLFTVLFRVWLR